MGKETGYEYALKVEKAVRHYMKRYHLLEAKKYANLLQKRWVNFTLNSDGCLKSIHYDWYDRITVNVYGIWYEPEHGNIEKKFANSVMVSTICLISDIKK